MKSFSNLAHEIMYLSNALASVSGHPDGYLRIEWHTVPMVSTEVRLLFDQVLNLLRQEQFHRLFTERTGMPPLHTHDCQWVKSEWAPRAAREAGLTHCAIVETQPDLHQRGTPAATLSAENPRPQFRFLDSFTQAEAWIRVAS